MVSVEIIADRKREYWEGATQKSSFLLHDWSA
jgi:hypothetical protein